MRLGQSAIEGLKRLWKYLTGPSSGLFLVTFFRCSITPLHTHQSDSFSNAQIGYIGGEGCSTGSRLATYFGEATSFWILYQETRIVNSHEKWAEGSERKAQA
jgi:hypothetical protein